MGLFVTVKIDGVKCEKGCTLCVHACPVDIFIKGEGSVTISRENEDECTFCDICLDRCPREAIKILKNY